MEVARRAPLDVSIFTVGRKGPDKMGEQELNLLLLDETMPEDELYDLSDGDLEERGHFRWLVGVTS